MPDRQRPQLLSPDLLIGLTLLAFGCAELSSASSLPVAAEFTLGAGALPVIYSIGLILFSALLVLSALLGKNAPQRQARATHVSNGLKFLGLIFAFAVLIYLIGFLLSSIVFSISMSYLVCGLSWKRAIIFGLIWSVSIFVLFNYALKVPLETGLLFS